jgi:two-component system OmpR family response regulator
MRVLVAEDDADTTDLVMRALSKLGHVVTAVATGGDALHAGVADTYDVIVLDRMLPGINGVEVLQRWRAAGIHTPVLMLTALGGIADRVGGLEAGADDYLVKPFATAELAARLTALQRRPVIADLPTRLQVGTVTLDLLRREVWRAEREVHLQPREFALLEQLMRHAGEVVTRSMFLERVWGFHFDPQTNIVESHLSRLRSKLKHGFAIDPIETLRGVGYRMRLDFEGG